VLAMQLARGAIIRGERVCMYLFDERITAAWGRAEGLWTDLKDPLDRGQLVLKQIEPTEMSPGEFSADVARMVDEEGVSIVVLDSLNGYLQAIPNERHMPAHVHELLTYLGSRGVTMIMTLVQRGIFGAPIDDVAEVSYLADTVILLRYFEHAGAVRSAISVVKKRTGAHERTIRECRIGVGGMLVGEPLEAFRGVLTGVPVYSGELAPLMPDRSRRGRSQASSADLTADTGPARP